MEMTPLDPSTSDEWTIYVDGSSNSKGSGAGIILENPEGVSIEHSLKFDFLMSNNRLNMKHAWPGYEWPKNSKRRR